MIACKLENENGNNNETNIYNEEYNETLAEITVSDLTTATGFISIFKTNCFIVCDCETDSKDKRADQLPRNIENELMGF